MIITRKKASHYWDEKIGKILVSFAHGETEKEVSDEIGKRYNELTGSVQVEDTQDKTEDENTLLSEDIGQTGFKYKSYDETEIQKLRDTLLVYGVKVDQRWKEKRLLQEMEKAKNGI